MRFPSCWAVIVAVLSATAAHAACYQTGDLTGIWLGGNNLTGADYDAFNAAGGGLLASWDDEAGHHVTFIIPEPATGIMLLFGMVAMLFHRDVVVS